MFPDTFVHPAIREGMGAAPAPGGATARLGYWCFETMTPLVAGTYARSPVAVDVALDRGRPGARRRTGRVRALPAARPPRAAGRLRRLLLLQQRRRRRPAPRGAAHGARSTVLDVDYHHGNGTQQIFYERDDVQYVSLHGDPNRAYPYFAGYADETGAGAGPGRQRSTCRSPPGTDDDALPGRAGPGAARPSTRSARRRWSSRSASTPTSSTRSPTSRSPPTASPASARMVAALGRPTDRAPGGRLPRADDRRERARLAGRVRRHRRGLTVRRRRVRSGGAAAPLPPRPGGRSRRPRWPARRRGGRRTCSCRRR